MITGNAIQCEGMRSEAKVRNLTGSQGEGVGAKKEPGKRSTTSVDCDICHLRRTPGIHLHLENRGADPETREPWLEGENARAKSTLPSIPLLLGCATLQQRTSLHSDLVQLTRPLWQPSKTPIDTDVKVCMRPVRSVTGK